MTSLVIIVISGLFALVALIGVLDLLVHLVCKGAQTLFVPRALKTPESPARQPPEQGITA
jgi:hypothetical protein